MNWWLIIWLVGVIAALAGSAATIDWGAKGGRTPNMRKQLGIIALCLVWPWVFLAAALGMLMDLAGFLIALARKPH